MKQIVDKLNKIAKKINENVELSDRDLIIDSLDSITKAYGGTPNDSTLIVDKLDDIYNNISPAVSGNIEITENGENINVAPYATATVNVSGGGGDYTTAEITIRQTNYTQGFNPVSYFRTNVPVIYDGEYAPIEVSAVNDSITVSIPLYQGSAVYLIEKFIEGLAFIVESDTVTFDATGDISFDSENGTLTVSGDCSIGVGNAK